MPDELDRRLRAADPVDPATLPSASDTNEALSRLSALRARRNRRPAFARPTWVLGTTGALAAAAIVAVLLFSAAATPTPSYAVTRHRDGTVTVRIASPLAVQALNHRLQVMGVPARITLAYAAASAAAEGCGVKTSSSLETFSFDPRAIPVGHLLVLTADPRLHFLYARAVAMAMAARVASGQAALQALHLNRPLLARLPAAAQARLLRLRFSGRGDAIALPRLPLMRMITVHGHLVARPLLVRRDAIVLPRLLMLRTLTAHGRLAARPMALAYARAAAGGAVTFRRAHAIRILCAK
jgi:hypothetical protein